MSNYSNNQLNLENKNTSWFKIFNFVHDNSMILDIGCSSGRLGSELKKQKNSTVYGTEIDKGDYLKAKDVLDKSFFYNLETEELPNEITAKKYDYIIFADVIEHLVDPVSALEKVKPLLKSDGKIIFSIPNMGHISVRLQLLTGNFNYTETGLLDKTHLHFYNFAEVKRVFKGAGFQIARMDNNTLTYPKSFLKKKLADLKLADKGFIETMSKDEEANAFQFVGYATKLSKGAESKITKLNTSTPEKELTDYINSLNSSVESLQKDLKASNALVASNERALESARAEIANIKSSKSWKAGRAITSPLRAVSSKKKAKH